MTRRLLLPLGLLAMLTVTAVLLVLGQFRSASAAGPARAGQPTRFTGVNLGAGSFRSTRLPGTYDKDYRYPTRQEGQPFLAAGMNSVRVPVIWERLQPAPMGDLDDQEMRRLDASINQLDGFGLIILDIHNYAAYRQPGDIRRTPLAGPRGAAMLADLWSRLARRYGGNRRIAFGIMNEPNGMTAADWRPIGEAALAAIRKTGARNLVLMPGTRWSGAASWTSGGEDSNAAVMAAVRDPANNMVFDLHQYFDGDSSGTSPRCVTPDEAARRLAVATDWLRANKARAFLSEFGVSADSDCLATLQRIMTELRAASDVWIGWTWWAAGDWWGKYMFNLQPTGGIDRPQMTVLRSFGLRARGAAGLKSK